MVRKWIRIVTALMAVFIMSSSAVFALGVGDINVHSGLNEKLDADIILHSVRPSDIDSIKVALASNAEFAIAGIDRNRILLKLRFKIKQRKDGSVYIKVRTTEAVREPFLNFLLEVNWAQGRLLREYTVLLDPPVLMEQKAAARIESPTQPKPQNAPVQTQARKEPPVKVISPPAPVTAPAPVPEVVVKKEPEPVSTTGKIKGKAKPEISQAPPVEAVTEPMPTGPEDDLFPHIDIVFENKAFDTGRKTTNKDTLWSIAKVARPDASVSVEQMMLAILKANPDAFYENNINALREGHILRIPGRDEITTVSKAEALRIAEAQHVQWEVIKKAASKDTNTANTAATGIKAGPEEVVEAEVKLTTVDKSKGVSGAGDAAGSAAVESMRKELALVSETLDSKVQANTELQSRVKDLEAQISSLEKLLTLKDGDLAAVQKQITELHAATDTAAKEEEEKAAAATAIKAEEIVAAAAAREAEEKAAAENAAVMAKEAEEKAAAEQKTAESAAGTTSPAESGEENAATVDNVNPYAVVEPGTSTVTPAPKPVTPTTAPAPVEQPEGIVAQITGFFSNIMGNTAMLGALVVVVLGLGSFVWVVINRRRASTMEFPESILSGKTTVAGEDETDELASVLSDFTGTSVTEGSAEVGEIDPLAEADVFIAYRRFSQAEEMLTASLEQEPDRADLKLKLMEVYAAMENRKAFENLAGNLHTSLDGSNSALWDKAVTMGKALCPDSPLFGGGEDLAPMTTAPEESVMPIADLTPTADEPAESFKPEDTTNDDLEFQAATDSSTPAAEAESKPEDDGLGDLEFDLGGLDTFDEADSSGGLAASMNDDAGLDFSLDIDLDSTSGDTPADATPLSEDTPLASDDEVATKLDLARAYIDMGDPDGARNILDEVVSEGNAEQKKEAEELIGQL